MTAAARNRDLLPTPPEHRTATSWEFAGLWTSLVVGVPSFYIAGTLVEKGMSWWQGIAVVVSAKVILLGPLLLAGDPGARYGVPFPVLARAAFGVRGAHIPALLRSLIACVWFGIESWIGGQSLYLLLPSSVRSSGGYVSWLGTSPPELGCFLVFWAAQLALLWKGMRGIRALEKYSAPVLVFLSAVLLCWAVRSAGGFGPMLSLPPRLSPTEFWAVFFPSLTANVGSWGAVALSISDFTRFARSQADQVLGQLGLPLFMGSFAFVGLAVTSATAVIFGRVISNPIDLLAEMDSSLALVIAAPGIVLAIVTTNIPANIVSPANALVSISPSTFSFRGAAVATAIAAIAFQPWRIFRTADSFVYTWLVGYAAIMGPLAGIILADYYVIRRRVLDVGALYSDGAGGEYFYFWGYNLAAVAALVGSVGPVVPGFLHKTGFVGSIPAALVFIYDVGWFFGFFAAGVLYCLLSVKWSWRGVSIVRGGSIKVSFAEPLLVGPK